MFIIIEDKCELDAIVEDTKTILGYSHIKTKHHKLKETIAANFGFQKFASLLKTFSETFGELSNKTFADKITNTQSFGDWLYYRLLKGVVHNYEQAIKILDKLDKPEVFWDMGWGDSALYISLINDGDGQKPLAYISRETFVKLKKNNLLGENILQTHKARKLFVYNQHTHQ